MKLASTILLALGVLSCHAAPSQDSNGATTATNHVVRVLMAPG